MNARSWRLALHSWTLDTTPLEQVIGAAATAGFDAVELRRIDFRRGRERGRSDEEILELIRAGGLPVACLGVEYGWLFASGDESRRLFDDFGVSCANAVALGCPLLMSAPGQNSGSLADAAANVRKAAEIAGEHGLKLALEFNSQHPVLNGIDVMSDLLARADMNNCGMLLDAYHLERCGHGGRGFVQVPAELIFAFQYSDVPPTPVGATGRPTDRLAPGEGVVRWRDVFGLLAEKGYQGHLSYEAPNPAHWARPPADVARQAVDSTRRLIGEALAPAP